MDPNEFSAASDYDSELLKLKQRLALAQAMQQRAMTPQQPYSTVGGRVIPNYAGMVEQIKGIKGKRDQEAILGEMAGVMRSKEGARATAADQYGKLRFGTTENLGQDTRALDESGAEGAAPDATLQTPGNQVAAAMYALKNPLLADIGKEDLKGLATQQDILTHGKNYDPQALQDFTRGAPAGQLKGRRQFTVHAGVGVTSQDGDMVGTTPVEKYGPTLLDPATGAPGQYQEGTGKFRPMGTYGSVNPTGVHAESKMIDKVITDLGDGATKLQDFARQVPSLEQMPDIIKGMSTGQFADYKMLARKVGEAFGMPVDTSKIANGETFDQIVGPQMLSMLKQFGSSNSLTDTDREAATKISAASSIRSPEALMNAQKLFVTNMLNKEMQHAGMMTRARKLPGMGDKVDYFNVDSGAGRLADKLGITYDPKTKMFTANIVTQPENGAAPNAGPNATKFQDLSNEELLAKVRNGEL